MHLKVVRDKFSSSCVTSDACNAHSTRLALEMRQNSGMYIYLFCSLGFFFPLDEAIVQGTLLLTVFLLTSLSMVCVCVCVRGVCSCMIISKAVGSKRAAQCRILAVTNEQRVENQTYERKAEQRSDSLSG